MGSCIGLAIGLSFVFGCILMGLVAQCYYLLWWKRKLACTSDREIGEFSSFFLCWKKPNSFNSASTSQELTNSVTNHQEEQQDLEMGSNKDMMGSKGCEEGIETELMRIHNLCGPPRFLFTIKEESKEDLESDQGKSRKGSRTESLSDLVFSVDGVGTPPLSSPRVAQFLESYSNHGFNPLFGSSLSEAEVNRLRSSPPPKFKFLKDAEDKLIRKLLMEEAEMKRGLKNEGFVQDSAAITDSECEKNGR